MERKEEESEKVEVCGSTMRGSAVASRYPEPASDGRGTAYSGSEVMSRSASDGFMTDVSRP